MIVGHIHGVEIAAIVRDFLIVVEVVVLLVVEKVYHDVGSWSDVCYSLRLLLRSMNHLLVVVQSGDGDVCVFYLVLDICERLRG